MTCEPWHSYLKYRRLKRGFSLRDLERVSGVVFSKLQRIEARTAPPTFVEAFTLAQIFDTFPENLFDPKTGMARTCREMEISA